MRSFAFLLLALLVAWCLQAPAQEVISATPGKALPKTQNTLDHKWESVHFSLYMDFANEAYALRLLGDLERFFSRFQKEYWDFIRPPYREAHIDVASVGTQDLFDMVAGKDASVPPGEKGYSNREANRIAFLRQDEYYKDIMIIVHELAHVFNRFSLDAMPIWLDEGMAQYYAKFAGEECGNPNIRNGVSQDTVKKITAAVDARTLVSMPAFFRMTRQEYYDNDTDLHYAESWSIVYYLRRGVPGGEDLLARYYTALPNARDQVAAFGDIFGPDMRAIEADWLVWNRSLQEPQEQTRRRTTTYVMPLKDK